jgi:sugar (pentulose or hexulose) kinase
MEDASGYAIAVLDIGMTNKKISVYSRDLALLESASAVFKPLMVDDIETHDLAGMRAWFLETLGALARRHPVKAVSVATHGATFVCVGEDGEPCVPCVYYTHEPGREFHKRFFDLAGDPGRLQLDTGSPRLAALINSAQGMLFAKERFPEQFARTRKILFFPQYFGAWLTGKARAESTYPGCHSYLWDFTAGTWSSVAKALGVDSLLPDANSPSWSRLGNLKPEIAARCGLPADTLVTMGIHDSNASLLPYLAAQASGDFVLDSTGTWCVLMHPQKDYGFSRDDLGKVVFFNRAATLDPVKTAIFLGGLEYETYSGLINRTCGRSDVPGFDPETYRRVIRERRAFILPEIVCGSGQFDRSIPRAVESGKNYPLAELRLGERLPGFFRRREEAFAALNLSLAIQTHVALKRVGMRGGTEIFIEGGFRRNRDYAVLLASLVAPSPVNLTDIPEATALGGAMIARMAMEGSDLPSLGQAVKIGKTRVNPGIFEGLASYEDAYLALAEMGM